MGFDVEVWTVRSSENFAEDLTSGYTRFASRLSLREFCLEAGTEHEDHYTLSRADFEDWLNMDGPDGGPRTAPWMHTPERKWEECGSWLAYPWKELRVEWG